MLHTNEKQQQKSYGNAEIVRKFKRRAVASYEVYITLVIEVFFLLIKNFGSVKLKSLILFKVCKKIRPAKGTEGIVF